MVEFATQVKRRRGTTAENDAFTGAEGEITVDTEKHELRVHDGMTQGGHIIPTNETLDFANKALDNLSQEGEARFTNKANTDLSNTPSNIDYVVEKQEPTAGNGYTWYRKYKSGWVEQGGIKEVGPTIITFPVAMANTDYWYIAKGNYNNTSGSYASSHDCVMTKNTTNMVLSTGGVSVCWQVNGISA